MIAVRCRHCGRRFALFCLGEGDPCPFCGKREITEITPQDAPPAVHEPPAMERVPITERTIGIARELVLSALVGNARNDEQESEP